MLRAPAGVCETCDLVRVAGTQEANETRPRFFMPMAHHVEPPRRLLPVNGDGASPESRDGATTKFPPPASPGEPRQKRKYVRRKPLEVHDRARGPGRPPKAGSYDESLGELRARWTGEREKLQEQTNAIAERIRAIDLKLEVLDDVEKEIRAATK
jgi:hypothetical protein